jgi:hypothetical protein
MLAIVLLDSVRSWKTNPFAKGQTRSAGNTFVEWLLASIQWEREGKFKIPGRIWLRSRLAAANLSSMRAYVQLNQPLYN